ncbi:MAG: SDR family NAD(P)-dependent oxidoreductase [Saprospiraceae bacterium]|nr:SDR family NAD(P)-dependent oxidoreductase [Saprospiraceae bacterium]
MCRIYYRNRAELTHTQSIYNILRPCKQQPQLKKNVIVTGANSGLGLWTTRHLLDLGYQVILACRDVNKTKQVMAKLPKVYPENAFRIKKLDLADFTSIRSFVLNLPDDEKYMVWFVMPEYRTKGISGIQKTGLKKRSEQIV